MSLLGGRRWLRSREDGAAATEFVLIAPILVVIFFGIVYVGLTVYRTQVIEAAAREGARVASVGFDMDAVEAAVDEAAVGFTDAQANVDTAASDLCTTLPGDTTIVVTAGGPTFSYTIPFLGSWNPDFSATATFRCEQRM